MKQALGFAVGTIVEGSGQKANQYKITRINEVTFDLAYESKFGAGMDISPDRCKGRVVKELVRSGDKVLWNVDNFGLPNDI